MDAISVTARRGGVVESVHRVHAVAVQEGAVVAEAGDAAFVTFFRSSAKPVQALALVRARPDLDDAGVAIACASHQAEPAQLDAVRALLAHGGATEEELECGPQAGRPPERVCHNCSGKHAGMLAVCAARGWAKRGYRLAEHPLQREIATDLAELCELSSEELAIAVDGCGVPTFALPLERMAFAFSRLGAADGGDRVAAAMRARPELVGGEDADDTDLMRALPGWVAKRGAEGLFCAVGTDGLAVALKVEDGSKRAVRPALAALLEAVERPLPAFAEVPVRNSRGEEVGRLSAE